MEQIWMTIPVTLKQKDEAKDEVVKLIQVVKGSSEKFEI